MHSDNRQLRYSFFYIANCNMCGSDASGHRVMGKRLNASQGRNPRKKTGITTTVMQCTNCSLIFSNPQPVPYDIQDHYGIPPEQYWVQEYFTEKENYFQLEIERLKTLIDVKPGMKFLDIGAGLGKSMVALTKEGFDAYGFEPSKPFYDKAIELSGISPDRLKHGMMEEIEYPASHFEFISFGAVLEHLYDPSGSIIKALSWLKPGGILHIEVPSSSWLVNKIINFYYAFSRTDYVGNISPMHTPFHLYEFGLKSFTEHAAKNNYEIAFHEYFVGDTFLPKYFDFILKPVMEVTKTGMQLSIWLRKN